jgi:hypothetical protein
VRKKNWTKKKLSYLYQRQKWWVKTIQYVSLTVGIALRFCPTAESTVAIGYSDGKFPWVQRDKVDGRKRPSV